MSDDLQINELINVRQQLAGLLSSTHSGKRDLYKIFGYKESLKPLDYRNKYDRGDIAARIVTAYPDAVWSKPPIIIEDEETQDRTEFETQFDELAKKINLWHYIHRADILAQLGRYSILFLGIADNQTDLKQPAGNGEIAYLMSYGEDCAEIVEYERDVTSPRFNKPTIYRLTLHSSDSQGSQTLEVHHSRVVHIAERTLDNDTFGKSILERIFNRLEDLEKTVGGGAETFWMNSRGGLSVEADKDVEITNPEKVKEDIEKYVHQLTRVIRTKGMSVNPLDFAVHSPKDQVDVILMLISGATGIPKRILSGSEQGSLASTQDEKNWLSRVDERRTNFCENLILAKVFEKFTTLGIIPDKEGFSWEWPELSQLTAQEAAEVAQKRAQAIATYANSPESEYVVPPQQFVEDVMNLEYREGEIEELQEEEDKEIEKQLAQQKAEGIVDPLKPKPQEETE